MSIQKMAEAYEHLRRDTYEKDEQVGQAYIYARIYSPPVRRPTGLFASEGRALCFALASSGGPSWYSGRTSFMQPPSLSPMPQCLA